MRRQLVAVIAMMLFVGSAHAQIMPSQAPENTAIGPSAASNAAIARLGLAKSGIRKVGSMVGPTEGRGRSRHEIQTHKITDAELPGVDGYFLRSSYVVLEPGGVAPVHSHEKRPAFLQVVSGQVTQHRSEGVSFLMGQGDFTFSSDGLAHWWFNESPSALSGSAGDVAHAWMTRNVGEPMRLWVVEICTVKHGCDKLIDEGAVLVKVTAKANRASVTGVETVMAIDLAGEFPDAAQQVGDRELRLRKIKIEPGKAVELGADSVVGFARVDSGKIVVGSSATGRKFESGTVLMSSSAGWGRWTNNGNEIAVIFAVEMTRAGI